MKKGNLEDVYKILGYSAPDILTKKGYEDLGQYIGDDDEGDIEESVEEAEESYPLSSEEKAYIQHDEEALAESSENETAQKPDISTAIDRLRGILLGEKKILDINDFKDLKSIMETLETEAVNKTYKSNPDYVGKLRALESKIENYKKEFLKTAELSKRLYIIAQAEDRLYRHLIEYGGDEVVLTDIDPICEKWYNFLKETVGVDLNENRDIGYIIYTMKEKAKTDRESKK